MIKCVVVVGGAADMMLLHETDPKLTPLDRVVLILGTALRRRLERDEEVSAHGF